MNLIDIQSKLSDELSKLLKVELRFEQVNGYTLKVNGHNIYFENLEKSVRVWPGVTTQKTSVPACLINGRHTFSEKEVVIAIARLIVEDELGKIRVKEVR